MITVSVFLLGWAIVGFEVVIALVQHYRYHDQAYMWVAIALAVLTGFPLVYVLWLGVFRRPKVYPVLPQEETGDPDLMIPPHVREAFERARRKRAEKGAGS